MKVTPAFIHNTFRAIEKSARIHYSLREQTLCHQAIIAIRLVLNKYHICRHHSGQACLLRLRRWVISRKLTFGAKRSSLSDCECTIWRELGANKYLSSLDFKWDRIALMLLAFYFARDDYA